MVRAQPRDAWIAMLEAVGVPCGPINDLDEVFANEQVRARGMEIALPHPTAGNVKLVRSPMRMSATPATSGLAPPLLGEHTAEVLRDVLGKNDAEIAALRADGIV
jgi:crotonobetainyl-CoA:carnitine CoA-transferase CaiB-like acyl-CoA transferase